MANNQTITKKEAGEIMKIPGKARGVTLQTDAEYVQQRKGKEGVLRVEEEIKKLGYPIRFEEIKATEWYPVGLRAVSLLVIKQTFGWDEEKIKEMGNLAPKYSFVVKSLVKYFLTFQRSFKESPKYWERHYLTGRLEATEHDLEKKYFILRLKDFKVHPVLCVYFGGYFMRMGQLILRGSNFQVRETKCMFRGGPYHEFLVTWE